MLISHDRIASTIDAAWDHISIPTLVLYWMSPSCSCQKSVALIFPVISVQVAEIDGMLATSVLSQNVSQRFGIEQRGLELVQRNPFKAHLPPVRLFSSTQSGAVLQGTGEHELDLMHIAILSKFMISADIFAHTDQVPYVDGDREFLATFALESAGERFARKLPTAWQNVVKTFGTVILDSEEARIYDDDGFGGISDRFHTVYSW
jgi:hypothetical protein